MVTKNNGDYLKYKINISQAVWSDIKDSNIIDYWTLRRLYSDMGKLIIEEVLTNVQGFELPYTFGCLKMAGTKALKLHHRKEVASKLEYARTDNVIYSMRWLRKNAKLKLNKFYKFRPGILIRKKILKKIQQDKFFNWIIVPTYNHLDRLDC